MYNLLIEYKREKKNEISADDFLDFATEEMEDLKLNSHVTRETVDQNSCDLWHDMRIGRITASIIYEASKCKTPNGQLKNRILGNVSVPQTHQMQRGLRLEKEVLSVASKILNKTFTPSGLLLKRAYPAIGASPDAVGTNCVVEIKCPSSQKTVKNYLDPKKNSGLTNKCYYQIQVQMYMKRVQFGYFVVADPDFETTKKVTIKKVRYNPRPWVTKRVMEKAMDYWCENIFPAMWDNI